MILQNYTGRNTDEVSRIMGELVGTVVIKSLFNGYGIFKDSHMFAIYRNNVVYIRAVGELAKLILQLGGVPYPYTSPSNMYFYLPKEITEDKQKYRSLILLSIEQVKQEKQQTKKKRQSRIKDLPNLNFKHELLLDRVDIKNVRTLRQVGAIETYIRIRKLIGNVHLDLFWKLVGALQHRYYSLITYEERLQLLQELNFALKNANLSEESMKFRR
ncbi:TfoX/Sxy family DNA transformation protein [Gallibacterium anatis]|uniref:Regulator of competence-specific genes n=2 Tax=Gallibacterium anatis TaxID=750 RepID=A0A0A2YJL7_9PAST|nr:TfoX/Sxy family DNA transformation protein [Gallibacterium anatis]AEC16917.1 TfoX C-terminal domain protein [Gallibacterium anatis UMN179]KGQ23309.1 hypothetical protein JP31_11010 [Gallibacterium anatis]KGQ24628.1 hypothetical protein JP33_07965 [Gallibacterium anatis CCM5995]KGQ29262.1 hypothetical protein JP27_01585 [Gallibacterium anatis]KGQ31980.1 hypothetical protein JP32_05650 [Gallibacterium anatis]